MEEQAASELIGELLSPAEAAAAAAR